jgi:mRNA-degrading endonuclease RelE of RelBE toxin-antitoxin system
MTAFTVHWLPTAETELAHIYNTHPSPANVTKADAAIETILRFDPIGKGAHLAEGLYRLAVGPLVVYYSVDSAARTVEVSNVTTAAP